jgi:glutamyl-tRNA reductase
MDYLSQLTDETGKQKNHIPAAELLSKKSKRSLMFGPKEENLSTIHALKAKLNDIKNSELNKVKKIADFNEASRNY